MESSDSHVLSNPLQSSRDCRRCTEGHPWLQPLCCALLILESIDRQAMDLSGGTGVWSRVEIRFPSLPFPPPSLPFEMGCHGSDGIPVMAFESMTVAFLFSLRNFPFSLTSPLCLDTGLNEFIQDWVGNDEWLFGP